MQNQKELVLSPEDKIEFAVSMEAGRDKLHELKLKYLQAQIEEARLKDLFDAVYKEVLDMHSFFVSADYVESGRFDIKPGDRITETDHMYFMNDADFEILLGYANKLSHTLGYVDKNGNYNPGYNGSEIRLNAEHELVDFQLSLFPEVLKGAFKDIKKHSGPYQKFLKLIMGEET